MNRFITIVLVGIALGSGGAKAQSCTSYPTTLTNGSPADASLVMGNFNYIAGCSASNANPSFTGNVGIGTTTPAATLDVEKTTTATSGTIYGTYSNLIVNPTGGASSASYAAGIGTSYISPGATGLTGRVYGYQATLNNASTGTVPYVTGFYNAAYNQSTGTLTTAYGAYNKVGQNNTNGSIGTGYGSANVALNSQASGVGMSFATGSVGQAENGSTGTISNALGSKNEILNDVTGTITTGYASYNIVMNSSTGTISTAYGNYITLSNAGTVSNWYDVYIAAPTNSGTISNSYALYSADTSKSYLAGSLGIGTTNPTYPLYVNGTAYATAAAGGLSDIRHKDKVVTLAPGALNLVEKLRPVSFYWKDPKDDGMKGEQIGLIAQEVVKVLPSVVLTDKDPDKTMGIKYTELIPVLVKAIQEQEQEIVELRATVAALKSSK